MSSVIAERSRPKISVRYASLDFIRGVAMLGVLLFHVLNVAYANTVDEVKNALTEGGSVPVAMIILAVILIYFGMFNGLFVLISGMVNLITMNSQWARLQEKGLPANDVAKKIFMGQFVRGVFTFVMGMLSEWILNGILLDVIIGEDISGVGFVRGMYLINILQTIGLCTIISSGVYCWLRLKGKDAGQMVKIFIIACVIILVLRPFMMLLIDESPLLEQNMGSGWENRSFGVNFGLLFLAPLIGRLTPLIPYLTISFAGTALGIALVTDGLTKKFVKQSLLFGAALCVAALVSTAIEGIDFDTATNFGAFLSAFGGEIIATMFLLYIVDFREKTEKFGQKTIFFRRIALVTLTLWNTQWIMVFPLYLFDIVTGWGAVDGNLNGYQLMLLLALITLFWYAILKLWERVDYKYSFEWLANQVIGKARDQPSSRLKVKQILYQTGTQQVAEEPREDKKGTE